MQVRFLSRPQLKIIQVGKKIQIHEVSVLYRGYQIWIRTCATSKAEAARKLEVSPSYMKSYGMAFWREDRDTEFEGVHAFIDSGWIMFEKGRSDLKTPRPRQELEEIITQYVTEKYNNQFK